MVDHSEDLTCMKEYIACQIRFGLAIGDDQIGKTICEHMLEMKEMAIELGQEPFTWAEAYLLMAIARRSPELADPEVIDLENRQHRFEIQILTSLFDTVKERADLRALANG